jgi:hypothetical protein
MNKQKSRHLYYALHLWLPGLLLLTLTGIFPAMLFASNQQAAPQLVVRNFSTREIIASIKVKAGDKFTLRYVHSVDKTPIFEEFRLDPDKGLVLEKTWFTMFGAGLGQWPGHGHLSQNKEWITIADIEQPLGSFILRIGALSVGHTIIYHGRKINLSRRAPGVRALVEFVR